MWYVTIVTLCCGERLCTHVVVGQCSKLGYYTVYDLQSGYPIVTWRFSSSTFSVSRSRANGVTGITRLGKVQLPVDCEIFRLLIASSVDDFCLTRL